MPKVDIVKPKKAKPVVVEKPAQLPKESPIVEPPPEPKAVKEKPKAAELPIPEDEKVKIEAPVSTVATKSDTGYYAPPSQVENWMPILEPGKGTVVEVSVAWKERIISSHHFSNGKLVTIGSDDTCDINVPVLGVNSTKYDLLKVDSIAKVNVTPQMSGVYVAEDKTTTPLSVLFRDGKVISIPNGNILDVSFGDMLVLELEGGLLTLYIRYVPQAPKTFGAPIFDLTTAESTAIVLATVVASIFSLYMMVYSPVDLSDENLIEEELVRKAKVTFKVPERKKVQIVDKKPVERKKFKVTEKKKNVPKKIKAKTPDPKKNSGKAKSVKPSPKKKKTNKLSSSVNKGGAIKTAKKKGANAKSVTVDPNKMGLLSVFGSKGTQKQLNKAYDGKGELVGMADNATGTAGFDSDREGDNLGGKIKNTGGGSGKSTVGIGGVGTKGKGTGSYGLGDGGLGQKGNLQVEVGGAEEDFVGSIDKEAIRRVIRKNKRAIKACYELALNRNKNLYGKLVLQWSIIEKGKAIKPKVVSNSLKDKEVANCIMRKLVTWRFPEPPENTEGIVTFPFVFSSQ